MTTPRTHAELAMLYFSDEEMKCWMWIEIDNVWRFDPNPVFLNHKIYHVGKTAPTEPPAIMCELAGVKFPMPAQQPLEEGDEYYVVCTNDIERPYFAYWGDSTQHDKARLNGGFVHLTWDAATKHSKALAAATKQAIEKAKEKTK